MKQIYFDTETSGLEPGQIGQLAMIILNDDQSIKAKNYFFDIDSVEEGAAKVTGRDVEFYHKASGGKRFDDYASEIYNEMEGAMLIAHNIKFDVKFLTAEFFRCNAIFTPTQQFDTMTYFKPIVKAQIYGKIKNPKLEELVRYMNIDTNKVARFTSRLFGIDAEAYHDAMYDTTSMFVAVEVYNDKLHGNKQWADVFCKNN